MLMERIPTRSVFLSVLLSSTICLILLVIVRVGGVRNPAISLVFIFSPFLHGLLCVLLYGVRKGLSFKASLGMSLFAFILFLLESVVFLRIAEAPYQAGPENEFWAVL